MAREQPRYVMYPFWTMYRRPLLENIWHIQLRSLWHLLWDTSLITSAERPHRPDQQGGWQVHILHKEHLPVGIVFVCSCSSLLCLGTHMGYHMGCPSHVNSDRVGSSQRLWLG
jgi:hypothetical protein